MKLQIRIDKNTKGKFDVQFLSCGKLLYFSNQDYSRLKDAKKTLKNFVSSMNSGNYDAIGPEGELLTW